MTKKEEEFIKGIKEEVKHLNEIIKRIKERGKVSEIDIKILSRIGSHILLDARWHNLGL